MPKKITVVHVAAGVRYQLTVEPGEKADDLLHRLNCGKSHTLCRQRRANPIPLDRDVYSYVRPGGSLYIVSTDSPTQLSFQKLFDPNSAASTFTGLKTGDPSE